MTIHMLVLHSFRFRIIVELNWIESLAHVCTYMAMHGYGDRRVTMEWYYFKSQHDFNWFWNWILTPTNPFENYFGFNSIYSSNTCRTSDWMSVWRIRQKYVCTCEASECSKKTGITQECQLGEHVSQWWVR